MTDTLPLLLETVRAHWMPLLGWLWLLTGVYLAARIVWQQRAPAATLAWILALCLIPFVGIFLYRFVGPQRVSRQKLRRMKSRALLAAQEDLSTVRQHHPHPPRWALQHSRLIEACCGIPTSSASHVQFFPNGADLFDALLHAVAQAQHHIHLEYYIFEPDHTGTRLLHALQERVRAGVTVRLLVDAVGSSRLLGRHGKALRQAAQADGVELAVFHPARFDRWRPLVNLRTHRKIVVCDGRMAFTGGINITDDENDDIRGAHAYRDTHMRLEGSAVRWLQYIFLQDWVYASGQRLSGRDLLCVDEPGDWVVHVIASGPDGDGQAIHHSMVHAISIAQQRVWLTTPYFVPTEPAWFALLNAARRGVDVRILVPARSDSLLVTLAARSYYDELRAAGARIFEYQPRMLHAKTLVVDEAYSLVGTANFDNRSFLLNFENAIALYGSRAATQLAAMFTHDLRYSHIVTRQSLQVPWWQQLAVAVARLMSPLL